VRIWWLIESASLECLVNLNLAARNGSRSLGADLQGIKQPSTFISNMASMLEETVDLDMQGLEILLAASHHEIEKLRILLRTGSANFRDPETLTTPLHAAIAACARDSVPASLKNGAEQESELPNGGGHLEIRDHSRPESQDPRVDGPNPEIISEAKSTVNLLLQNGAIWNDLDAKNETPGCIAHRLHLSQLYEIMVEAGVRAELLLGRLDQYQPLGDGSSSEGEGEKLEDAGDPFTGSIARDTQEAPQNHTMPPTETQKEENDDSLSNPVYLTQPLHLDPHSSLLDTSANAVMMAWESPIMSRTSELLLPTPDLRVLNVGHGLGLIDGFFRDRSPSAHHIIEAHSSVLGLMQEKGWYEREGVSIHEGRWQDVVPKLVEAGESFDAVYFDTFAESYEEFKEFMYSVEGLVRENGRWGFFCGGGADRKIVHDVWRRVVEAEMIEEGWGVDWEEMEVDLEKMNERGDWEGTKRRYWVLDKYHLPICTRLDDEN
jgi:protein arginine N-methyltransferase 2